MLCVDAGSRIGIGQLMRCLALAQAWQMVGGRVLLMGAIEGPLLRKRILDLGIQLISLDPALPRGQDLTQTLNTAKENAVDWVVLDGHEFGPSYQSGLVSAGCRVLVVDDNAQWPAYHADIILNHNIGAELHEYNRDPGTLLLGSRYALVPPEFAPWQSWQRQISGRGNRVLVTMGGSDPANVTMKVLRALQQMKSEGISAKVVVGPANPHLEN